MTNDEILAATVPEQLKYLKTAIQHEEITKRTDNLIAHLNGIEIPLHVAIKLLYTTESVTTKAILVNLLSRQLNLAQLVLVTSMLATTPEVESGCEEILNLLKLP